MEQVTGTKMYNYPDEVIVEILGTNDHGDFASISYQFAFEDEATVAPKGEIESSHNTHVEETLSDAGYSLVTR